MTLKNAQGFTLTELFIAMAMVAILFGIALPNLFSYVQAQESAVFTSTALRNLKLARSYSINHRKDITICGIDETRTCVRQNFVRLVVFHDDNNDHQLNDNETLIRETDINYKGEVVLRASFGRPYLEFTRDGSTKIAGSFTYCYVGEPRLSQRVTVSRTGRSYVAKHRESGVVTMTSGEEISC